LQGGELCVIQCGPTTVGWQTCGLNVTMHGGVSVLLQMGEPWEGLHSGVIIEGDIAEAEM